MSNIKSILKDFPFIAFGDLDVVSFNVINSDGEFNLVMDFAYIDVENQDSKETPYGFSQQTTIFGKSLLEVAVHVNKIMESGLFDNLGFADDATCYDINGDLLYDFSWDDYIQDRESLLN